ncbi:cleavage stimulating factor 64-like [Coffea eugenioides]|uniref:cleavage stimulating factor 64-like n=1 Tax=Coffea eugenioides TaxID=49369 RepID=UPI000F60B1B3|nr:cleavage stimulating factor 64-like [Coffea eugenioides]XP_027184120.1 cleavage stimulating factor 64-like [Coffea eugenioides]
MADSANQRCVVFVGNLPFHASEEEVTKKCEEVGPVVSFRLMRDKETGKRKGYGFCEYRDEETATSAIRNLNGEDLGGRKLRVNFADNDKNYDRNRKNRSNNNNQDQFGFGSDPLTEYLAKIPREKLIEIVSDMKKLAAENKEQARQLLHACPALPKAIYQVQVMLGIVPPQMVQMQLPNSAAAAIPQFAAESKGLDQSQLRVESIDSTQSGTSFLNDDHPSKCVKLNDGRAVSSSRDEGSQDSLLNNVRPLESAKLSGGMAASSSTDGGGSACDSIVGKLHISAEEESYLLQQVKNLTPEQISSLPPEQQQQVIQLQQMLIQQTYSAA